MTRIYVNDLVLLQSPHTDEHIIVSYRGDMGNGKAVVWTGRSQITVPVEWLKRECDAPAEYKKAVARELQKEASK